MVEPKPYTGEQFINMTDDQLQMILDARPNERSNHFIDFCCKIHEMRKQFGIIELPLQEWVDKYELELWVGYYFTYLDESNTIDL